MKLLTEEILSSIPALYATEEVPLAEKKIHAKFFTPWSHWTWYAVEFDPKDGLFFGLVDGNEREWGYFSLAELESVRGPVGLKIERDIHFGTKLVSEVL